MVGYAGFLGEDGALVGFDAGWLWSDREFIRFLFRSLTGSKLKSKRANSAVAYCLLSYDGPKHSEKRNKNLASYGRRMIFCDTKNELSITEILAWKIWARGLMCMWLWKGRLPSCGEFRRSKNGLSGDEIVAPWPT